MLLSVTICGIISTEVTQNVLNDYSKTEWQKILNFQSF